MEDNKPIIKASTPNSKKYDSKVDIYTDDPRNDHETIHIAIDSNNKSAHIIDTTSGETEHTDVQCYLTTACMRHMLDNFDDNCEELRILRWFRNNFVSQEDIEHYYKTAPIVVESINNLENNDLIYKYIYKNVIYECVNAIKHKNYKFAYSRYKTCIKVLEEKFARPSLEKRLVKALKHRLTYI